MTQPTGEPTSRPRSSISVLPWAVLAAALFVSALATWQAVRASHARAEARFLEKAAETSAAVQSKLDLYLTLLKAGAGLFVATDSVTPEEFKRYVELLGVSKDFRGLRGIAIAPRIRREDIPEFERLSSEIHRREINVWPQTESDEVFPIALAGPANESILVAFGFDLASNPARAEALRTARDTAEAAASSPIVIVETGAAAPRRGFLIALPLYGDHADGWTSFVGTPALWPPPPDIESRREKIRGFVIGAFIVSEMIQIAREARASPALPLVIHDGDRYSEQSLLYASPQAGTPGRAGFSGRLEIAGRRWTILCFNPAANVGLAARLGLGPNAPPEARLTPLIALLGLCFSLALFLVTRAQFRARSAAEDAATEARRQRAIAAESERRFRSLADAAPVMIWMADDQGRVLWVNVETVQFAGRPLDEIIGDKWLSLVHEDDRERVREAFTGAVGARRLFTRELCLRRHDGASRWILLTGQPVTRSTGEFAGHVGVGVDITDQKATMMRLREQTSELEAFNRHLGRLNAELARSNTELSDFASIAAHDLKEPLRGMTNYARFIREDYAELLPARGHEMIQTIERLAARLSFLLDALMEYARVGHGEIHVHETDLAGVLRQVKESLSAQIAQPDVELECRPLPIVRCDPVLTTQVFANLILNGLKYNQSETRRVEVGSLDSPGGPILYVRDNGIGIPTQHHTRIFRMFKRLHPRDAFGGGLGTGLAFAKKIIERHGGRIWVASEPGQGTTFYFTLSPEATLEPSRAIDEPATADDPQHIAG